MLVVRGRDLRLAGDGAVHQCSGVDLAVRVGVGGADGRAAVLEDQDVRDAVERLERSWSGRARW